MSVFQDFIKPTLVLAVICLVISFALAKTYSITQPIIDRLAIETANAARAEVLPGASDFEQLTVANMPEGGLDAYRATDGSGYVITTAWKGYGGTIKVMFGMDANGVITGAKVLENSETAGLGTKACDPKHMVQYTGKTGRGQCCWRCHRLLHSHYERGQSCLPRLQRSGRRGGSSSPARTGQGRNSAGHLP